MNDNYKNVINDVVNDIVISLNDSLNRHGIIYSEDLHDAIVNKFNDIAEEAYRSWIGKRF